MVNTRDPGVQAFVDSVRAGYGASQTDKNTRRCVDDVFAAFDRQVGTLNEGGRRLPIATSLPEALKRAIGAGGPFAAIATAFSAVEPRLNWMQRSTGLNASANIMDGHGNAMVVGPGGLEDRDDIHIGLSLLAPYTRYPDHQHGPEETYLALSPGEFCHGGSDWFDPGIGGSFYNEPSITHAMRSGDTPLFAVWCLQKV